MWDALLSVYQAYDSKRFIFVLDECDFIFHRNFVTDRDKADYIDFLSNLLKGKAYVSLAYMTGILPIAKYSSGSELNMFIEFSMAAQEKFSDYFGFTQTEVQELYRRYMERTRKPAVSLEGLELWYDGYYTASGERIYSLFRLRKKLSSTHPKAHPPHEFPDPDKPPADLPSRNLLPVVQQNNFLYALFFTRAFSGKIFHSRPMRKPSR